MSFNLRECMKIWCCLCFTQDDEPEEGDRRVEEDMKEGGFENEGNSEGNIGNEEEPEDIPRLGLAADGRERDDNARLFEGMVQAVRSGAHWDEAVNVGALASLRAAFRSSRRSMGESSSASFAAAAEDCDHDSHSKRAKVHSDFQ